MHEYTKGRHCLEAANLVIIRPRCSLSAAAYKLSRERPVGPYVHPSDCPVHCGKTADRIRMPFRIVGRTGPGMRHVGGFGDPSTGRNTFGSEFWARHCKVIVTNGDFTAYLCDSAAMRPSSQITLGRLVIM